MIFRARPGQTSYGEPIGILLLDTFTPFIEGDVGNAGSYPFPVRYRTVPGLSVERIFNKDCAFRDAMLDAARELVQQGVKAVTGDCGFMAIYQRYLAEHLEVPVFLSSLLQLPFIGSLLAPNRRIGIITANAPILDSELLEELGVQPPERLVIRGMQDYPRFRSAILDEEGELDSEAVETEMVAAAKGLLESEPTVGALLLECSVMPPYGAAVADATGLPVFDYLTMIEYVHSAVVKRRFARRM